MQIWTIRMFIYTTHIHAHRWTHTHTWVYMHIYTHTCVCMYVRAYIYIYVCAYHRSSAEVANMKDKDISLRRAEFAFGLCSYFDTFARCLFTIVCVCVCVCMRVCVRVWDMHTWLHAHLSLCLALSRCDSPSSRWSCARILTRLLGIWSQIVCHIQIWVCAYTHTHVCEYMYIYIYTYVYMYNGYDFFWYVE